MKKISEKVDLSKQILDIDIESPIFEAMLDGLNREILRVIGQVYDEEFEAGEISLKLNLEIIDGFKEFPKVNEDGEMINELYKFRRPRFEHKITTTLKKKYERKGVYTEEKDVQCKPDGHYAVVPIYEPQVRIEDIEIISN